MPSKKQAFKHVAIAGGVSANSEIRKRLKATETYTRHGRTYIPKFEYTTDNAGMIAIAGYLKYLDNNYSGMNVSAQARLKVNENH